MKLLNKKSFFLLLSILINIFNVLIIENLSQKVHSIKKENEQLKIDIYKTSIKNK